MALQTKMVHLRGFGLLLFIRCAAGGLNASWVFPTVGCFGDATNAVNATNNTLCPDSLVCQDVYLQVKFGGVLNFTLAATDNSSSIFRFDGIPHCNDATLLPSCIKAVDSLTCDSFTCPRNFPTCQSKPCYPTTIERLPSPTTPDPLLGGTGFNAFLQDNEPLNFLSTSLPGVYGSPFLAYRQSLSGPYANPSSITSGGARVTNVYPAFNNLTRVDFAWVLPKQEDVSLSSLPLYQLKFRARYAGFAPLFQTNTSGCNKTIFVRICGVPTFVSAGSKFLGPNTTQVFFRTLASPAWSGDHLDSSLNGTGFNNDVDMTCGMDNAKPCLTPPMQGTRNGASVLITTLQMSAPVPQDIISSTVLPSILPPMGIRVGQTVRVTVSARTLDPTSTLQLQVYEDPGLPIGMNRSAQYQCGLDSSTVCVDLMWTPHVGQDNYVHEAAFVAVQTSSPSIPSSRKPCSPTSSPTFVIRFPVTSPVSTWVQPTASLTLTDRDPGNVVVGTQYSLSLQCSSNYQPLIRFQDPLERGSLMPINTSYVGNGRYISTYTYSYTPVRGDEGTSRDVCFLCGDDQRAGPAQPLCTTLRTRLCSYTVQDLLERSWFEGSAPCGMPFELAVMYWTDSLWGNGVVWSRQDGDTLQSLTRRYQLNTNWLNLWNANPAIIDPDLQLLPGSRVRLGPTYRAREGDTLESIAGMFSTTVKMILSVNPALNLLPGMGIPGGSAVCVLTCTSQQYSSTFDLWP